MLDATAAAIIDSKTMSTGPLNEEPETAFCWAAFDDWLLVIDDNCCGSEAATAAAEDTLAAAAAAASETIEGGT